FYTAAGLEYAFHRYGILEHLERLGYSHFRVELEVDGGEHRMRLLGQVDGLDQLLVDCAVGRALVDDAWVLYVNWLSMQNPRAAFGARRPMLPGQQHPGLGLAREAGELLARMAERLGLEGVAFRPASYHMAFLARERCRFSDPHRQARFEALLRDLGRLPLA